MSDIRANTISDAAGTGPIDLYKQSAAKAWVNFNGVGTVAIRTSFSVSSLTDNAVGDYAVGFTNTFANEPCAVITGGSLATHYFASGLTASYRINHITTSSAATDSSIITLSAHGDLA